jgi:ribosomal protein S18 acetylase RimI-like enzyme
VVEAESSWGVRVANVDVLADLHSLRDLRGQWRGVGDAAFASAFDEWCRTHRDSHRALLGSLAGRDVAMAWLAIVDRVPGADRFVRRAAYLQSVFVSEDVRDRGLGARLVSDLVTLARALDLDYLAVHPSVRSFAFYRRLGFSSTERVLELDLRAGPP